MFNKKNLNKIPKMNNIHYIYLIGIGGSGMGGIATILVKQGYKISGSDISSNFIIKKLSLLNIKINLQHDAKNITNNIDLIIISSAIKNNNPELIAAKKLNIAIISRGEMLAELMRFFYGITITGSHGKTTTTAIVYKIFKLFMLDPTFVNGGFLKFSKENAYLGSSKYFIAEADESDKSFLYLNPIINIITNIESEHLDYYQNNIEILKKTFLKFLKKIPFYGCIIICIDNIHNYNLIKQNKNFLKQNIITYGFHKEADLQLYNYQQNGYKSRFYLLEKKKKISLEINLNIPGYHNALNSIAAFATASYVGLDPIMIIEFLKKFKGIERRFDILGHILPYQKIKYKKNIIIIDDYGHHPTEINITINIARKIWPNRKLVMVFQPHRYSRTKNLLNKFVQILSKVDKLFILNTYSAGENIIKKANSEFLTKKIRELGIINPKFINLTDYYDIANNIYLKLKGNEILIFQGAGNINNISSLLISNNFKNLKN
ncbi:UDP-N-acetylmuramate--L-alanine ligase [Enterobacteriaceae endosymbiont of Donacia bicoloricornis]|uniref:UDP-N-acetylmuramate--L-alanine ligase n=1 Tax=Enterobacteriaceae endosymbiont of Donacia bicoloricornis TaxID=2675772 RepID=UPI0014493D8E|nr:UDP-N-acetylmuramate--L-alanine ligase [Enterobacteriaceae endosymbiont of Donacia bicoloricornis]QJC37678.1 UDP-N-acetylmuramate--L-alanine ligase [Enterobacteriaceae endosymbiont of Donacia bicoloricornis]